MAAKPNRHTRFPALLQRQYEVIADFAGQVARTIGIATDARARMLRRRRRALRWAWIFTAGCAFWALLTAVLAAWGWFTLLLQITGAIAVVQVIPATLLFFRYHWLKSEPLPSQRPANVRRLPPPGSAARPAMYALGASERGLFSLLGVMEREQMLPAGEIADLTTAANRTSAAMASTAAQVVSMERAAHSSESSREYLVPTINAYIGQLGAGVRQYNEMVTAAAQLVSSASDSGSAVVASLDQQRYRDELAGATDRLAGWAQAFAELAPVRRLSS
ncbi:phage shock envelope stress response protein PspM [Mycobacterium sp.]|uniref:phage shock envelope stress response protein PspM n=1 Tax=Mycobacterium sp. TaxID=1785 RepID=UPI003A84FE3E